MSRTTVDLVLRRLGTVAIILSALLLPALAHVQARVSDQGEPATATPTEIPTATEVTTATDTPPATLTATAVPTTTPTLTPTATFTPVPSATEEPTATPTLTPTLTPTVTPLTLTLSPTLTVCAGECDFTTIQAAVAAASAGDTILIGTGMYPEHVTIDKELTLVGAGTSSTIVDGGGNGRVFDITSSAVVTLSDVTVTNGGNTDLGGGIRNRGVLTLQNSVVTGNTANWDGGGIYNEDGVLTVIESTVSQNTALGNSGPRSGVGGGLANAATWVDATLTISRSLIMSNTVYGVGGGGVSNSANANRTATLSLDYSIVTGNVATSTNVISTTGFGGGIRNGFFDTANSDSAAILRVSQSTISHNQAFNGGGIASGVTEIEHPTLVVQVSQSTISGNRADGFDSPDVVGNGGGLVNQNGVMSLVNSTVSGNTATGGTGFVRGLGGGLANSGFELSTTLWLTQTTVSSNTTAVAGGAIANIHLGAETVVHFKNSLLVGGCANPNLIGLTGALVSHGHNLDDGDTCNLTGASDLPDTAPLLGPLADNGGPSSGPSSGSGQATATHALLPGSPAIGAADSTICNAPPVNGLDQRGIWRGTLVCDIGAYETSPGLQLTKTATPTSTVAGMPLTFTLTVTNYTQFTATNLVITDALPAGASYLGGGVKTGNVVSWTVPSLVGETSLQLSFVVTATEIITNADYAVVADEGLLAVGQEVVTVTITDAPVTGLSASNDSPTPLGQATTLTATITAGTNVTYTWTFGDGETGSGPVTAHAYPDVGFYTAVVTASNSASQMAATTLVTITALPELAISKSGPASVNASDPITYTLTITNSGQATAMNLVITDALPVGAAYLAGGERVGDGAGGAGVVSWTLSSLATSATTQVSFVVTATETITNSDYAVVADGGVSAVGQAVVVTYIEPRPPVAGFSAFPYSSVAPALIQFFDNSTGDVEDYFWEFGDGFTNTLASPAHTYTAAGVYTVTLTVSGPGGSDTLVKPNYITVTEPVVANFSAFPYSDVAPALIQFFDNSTGDIDHYLWAFGDGISSTLPSPTHTYTLPGVYTVTLTVSGPGGSDTLAKPNYITVTEPGVVVTVADTGGNLEPGLKVYAFDGTTYTGYNQTTDASGQATFTLPLGDYRFRADKNDTQFWSSETNHCTVPGCASAVVTTSVPVVVTVADTDGQFEPGLKVYVFDETTYTSYNQTTDASGQATFTLPLSEYRFRADKNGTQFWSGETNHCFVPGCTNTTVTTTIPVSVTVMDSGGSPEPDLKVYVFDGPTYTGYNGTSDTVGQVSFTLPLGDYRFRADKNGTQYWSGETNHCTVPGCLTATVTIPSPDVMVTVQDTAGQAEAGLPVYVFDGTTYTGYNKTSNISGVVTFTLPSGEYRFRADKNGTQFWSSEANHCTVPGCAGAVVTTSVPVSVTVANTDGQPESGLKVYAFDETTYTGYNQTTDASGQASFTLPLGDYRFRADKNGTQYWSGETNHCTVPGCLTATVTIPSPDVTVTVQDTDGQVEAGLPVYVFDGTIYTGYNKTSNISGVVTFTLPSGEYRFRADKNGTQFWSSEANHCTVPGCAGAVVTTSVPVSVTVANTDGQPESGLKVYAFDETTYTGYNQTTDASGQASFTLPLGDYRFRADKNGEQYWSGENNHCPVPGCVTAAITTPGVLSLNISKTGPAAAIAGEPITYTLTVTNSGSLTATNLVITDAIPAGSAYITGGMRIGDVVSWTLPSLAVSATVQVQFVVTAPVVLTTAETITNSDYAVSADGGVSAAGEEAVTTLVYPPVVAGFYASPLTGAVPLTVTFTSTSTGASTLLWDLGDDTTKVITSPLVGGIEGGVTITHLYPQSGVYTVSLTAGNGLVTDTLTRTNYITVTAPISRNWRLITTTVSPSVVGEQAMAYVPPLTSPPEGGIEGGRVVLYGGNATGWPYENTTWEFDGTDWISVATTLSPAARYGAQMAYTASPLPGGIEGGIILFGGSDETDTALNQTWVYNDAEWSQLSAATAPLSRTYHSLATDPISGTLYLFGGNDGETYFNDLWRYEDGAWNEIPITGDKPPARTLAALTYTSPPQGGTEGGQLLLFGGRSVTGTLLADLWAFDLSTETWQLLDDGGGGGPPARMAHTLTYDPATGNTVLAGGTTDEGDTLLGDTWHYLPSSSPPEGGTGGGWTEATPVTPLPPRAYHQAIYTGEGIVLFSQGEVWRYE